MRPIYETQKDTENELRIAQSIFPNLTLKKVPISYGVDFCLLNNDHLVGWAEIKCRNKFYPDPFISLNKMKAGVILSRLTRKPFYLVYGFPDAIYRKEVKLEDLYRVGFGGRIDRNDNQDQEPMVFLNISDFLKFDNNPKSS